MLTETIMAGKSKKPGGRPQTSSSARGMMGHLGLKSNALAPVDSKLSSQYMVLDHMTAHYKNLNKVKATVDTTPPKAWLISQKARDRARRDAVKNEYKRRSQWLTQQTGRLSSRDSEMDRDELIAMMESFSNLDDDMDTVDAGPNVSSSEATSKVNRLNSDDIDFVNRLVTDSVQSPSRYHSQKIMKSNIPSTNARQNSKPGRLEGTGHLTPRGTSAYGKGQVRAPPRTDIIDKQAGHFTEEKPFTPRTLKSKPQVQSRLSTFKCYNPPKRSTKEGPTVSTKGSVRRGSHVSRPDTAYSDSVDLMNETLMSRDMNHNTTPSDVPPLDISLDADNMRWMKEHQKVWLKEQNRKAQIRASARTRSDAGSDIGSIRHTVPANKPEMMNGTRTLNASLTLTSRYPNSYTLMKVEEQEEELKYLEFLTDVTNDVLDRGIFTNRVLKQVFANHMERKKHLLKPDKMHDMLANLRQDLGIPLDHDDDGLGMNSTRGYSPDPPLDGSTDTLGVTQPPTVAPRSRRKHSNGVPDDLGAQRASQIQLRAGRGRPGSSGEGRPPLPRPVSRGSWSRPGSAASNRTSLHEVKEEAEDSSLTFTYSDEPSSGQADILKIDHEEPGDEEEAFLPIEEENAVEDHSMPGEITHVNGDDLDDTLTEQYTKYVDNMDDDDGGDTQGYDDDFQDDDVTTTEHDAARSEWEHDGHRTEAEHEQSAFESESEHLPDAEYEDSFEPEPQTPKEPPKPTPRMRSARSTLSSSEFRETPRSTEQTQTSESVTVSELDYVDDF